jgi:phenylalanyl-tRNA synthetase beta chain
MRVPLKWLKEMTELSASPEQTAERLTSAGLECEVVAGVEIPARIVTGKIVSCEKHPRADRLSVCEVDVGEESSYEIVCGAPNAEAGWVGAVALPGARLGEDFVIEKRKLRGVTSNGMLCSEAELGLSEDSDGILLLPPETEIGRPLGDVLSRETVLVTEPTSNRGDLMSVEGVAHEVAATSGRSFERRTPAIELPTGKPKWTVKIQDPKDCPRYCGRVVEGLAAGPSPSWLADRLQAAGVRPLWNLVDVTNYVLLELGHPLHAFDLAKLSGKKIGVRRSKKGETMTTLDGRERDLAAGTLLIMDEAGPVALGGIMGGESTMVTETTTSIFLEGASFAPPRVRAGARALKLVTDASARFERGVDRESVPRALDRACELLLQLCPDARVVEAVDAYPAPAAPARVRLRRNTLRRILGVELPDEETRSIFANLALDLEAETEEGWEVTAPTWRRDLAAEEDLVEEVARIHGYDRVPERAVARAGQTPLRHRRVAEFWRARRTLLSLGLTEVVTPSLVDGAFEDALVSEKGFLGRCLPLRNPLTADRSHLRGSLAPSLLRVLATNRARSIPDLAICEVGRTFASGGKSQVAERQRVGVLLAGLGTDASRGMGSKPCDFFDMKGLLEVYVEQFWEARLRLEDRPSDRLLSERSAAIVVHDKTIGVMGEIGLEGRKAFDLPADTPVVLAEFDISAIEAELGVRFFEPLPRYPGAVRDLAFVVSRSCRQSSLESTLREEGGSLLAELRLFDVYQGAPLGEREKSLAYTLVFRSPDRSLTHDEVDACVERIVSRVSGKLGGRLR